ncbi:unnamed protein product [Dovyalis caffra]|uniref:Uncharacterized protein n=1 Tax=Dovyalis caffra TaxID=77055 RepID=A0AAV1R911_9ROSI|nr:unnamed protein product [Dovyalis caffra]
MEKKKSENGGGFSGKEARGKEVKISQVLWWRRRNRRLAINGVASEHRFFGVFIGYKLGFAE